MNIGIDIVFSDKSVVPLKEFEILHGQKNGDFIVLGKKDGGSAVGYKKAGINYAFVAFFNERISLADLPVAGKLPHMSDVSISRIMLTAASNDTKDLPFPIEGLDKIKKGMYFSCELTIPGSTLQILIPITDGNQEFAHIRSDVTSLDTASENIPSMVRIDKAIGPFLLKALYFSYHNNEIFLGLDAALNMTSLNFSLDGLALGYNTGFGHIRFEILGLSLNVNSGALQIAGGFLKRDSHTYSGSLLVKVSQFSIMAIGSYTTATPEVPADSIFAFAILKASIGGPPCFFITGIALGFGYNRALNIPGIDKLDDFPLLMAAKGTLTPDDLLRDEKIIFRPTPGKNWVAAGVLFNSFKMIDSIAILTVSWGGDVEINLLGQSILNVPFNTQDTPIAHAVLLLKASFKPSQNTVMVDAKLSSESYIISKDCHLTGGFAFYTWYGGSHAGDFVLTLGGYHPRYSKPSHYPSVDRLGFNWRITSDLSAWGGIYFALTPSCVMAGGSLHISYSKGIVEAWFDAYLDIYMQWKPYHYDIAMGIHIGCKVDLWLTTVSLEFGCDLHIWGPEFSGIAEVTLWCVSFTIRFGSNSPQYAPPISTEEFVSSFLPEPDKNNALPDADTVVHGGCVVRIVDGVYKELSPAPGSTTKIGIANADSLIICAKSVVPLNTVLLNGVVVVKHDANIMLRPCDSIKLSSTMEISVTRVGSGGAVTMECQEMDEGVPAALWASADYAGETILACTGITFCPKKLVHYIHPVLGGYEKYDAGPAKPVWQTKAAKPVDYSGKDAFTVLKDAASPGPSSARRKILQALGEDPDIVNLTRLAKDPSAIFCEKPILETLGV